MNYKLSPEHEYIQLEEFYKQGENIAMPVELQRLEIIYRFVHKFLEKGYLSQSQIVNLAYSHFNAVDNSGESDISFCLTKKTIWNHVTNARKFYNEKDLEDSETHRLRLTKLAYKQIDFLKSVAKYKPSAASKEIANWVRIIQDLQRLKEPEQEIEFNGDTFFVLSDKAEDFPDIDLVPDTELYEMIEGWSRTHDLTEQQRKQLIQKDVKGAIGQ